MPSEPQWNEILNASLRIHRSATIVEAGEEALFALKRVLSTEHIELSLLKSAPPEPGPESALLEKCVTAGSDLFLHFTASYQTAVPKEEEQCFDVIVKHVICASQRLPVSPSTAA